jgi:cyclophilin family peptidyl-prolyl cis-trans isomerase
MPALARSWVAKTCSLALVALGAVPVAAQPPEATLLAADGLEGSELAPGIRFAAAHGDWTREAHAKFVALDAGVAAPVHVHSRPYHAVVLQGPAEVVVLDTSLGRLVIALDAEAAPQTVAHFRRLVAAGWYDGRPFYRVVAGHVVQAGDGGENDVPAVPLEPSDRRHVAGAVGLARDEDPASGSTELYICLAARPHLDGRYTLFGQVIEGLDVLAAIGAVPVEERWIGDEEPRVAFHAPLEPVVIERARLERRGEPGE